MARLASDYHLILITLKRISCPVCPQLLRILNLYGLDPNTNQYVDPFTQKVWEINPHRKRVKEKECVSRKRIHKILTERIDIVFSVAFEKRCLLYRSLSWRS